MTKEPNAGSAKRRTRLLVTMAAAAALMLSVDLTSPEPASQTGRRAVSVVPSPSVAGLVPSHAAPNADAPFGAEDPDAPSASGGVEVFAGRGVMPREVLLDFGPDFDRDELAETLRRGDLEVVARRGAMVRARLPEGETVAAGLNRLRRIEGMPAPAPNAIAWGARARAKTAAPEAPVEEPPAEEPPAEEPPAEEPPAEEPPAGFVDLSPIAPGSANTPIALIDSGVAYADAPGHPKASALAGIHFLPGYDFVAGDAEPHDHHQHGTHLASIIATIAGPNATIQPLRVLDDGLVGNEFDIAMAIMDALRAGARVINLSLSFGPHYVPSATMGRALQEAVDSGAIIVAAVGNDAADTVAFPAALRSVIAVGAVGAGDSVTTYSNSGSGLDVMAPGGGDDADTGGVRAETIALGQPASLGVHALSGTSQAAAYVSAVAARLLDVDPTLEVDEVRELLTGTARPLQGRTGYRPTLGSGVVDGPAALAAAAQAGDTTECVASGAVFLSIHDDDKRSGFRAHVLFEATDGSLRPMVGARVWADLLGSTIRPIDCTTDSFGRCAYTSGVMPVPYDEPLLLALRVNRVVDIDGRVCVPRTATRIDPERAGAEGGVVEGSHLIAAFPGATTAPDSLLGRVDLSPSYHYHSVGLARVGSGVTLTFNEAFRQQLGAELPIREVAHGIRLTTQGEGTPLMWINDAPEAVLAEGQGLMGSGLTMDFSWSTWLFGSSYAYGVGSGLMASGMVVSFADPNQFWSFNSAHAGDRFDGYGSGLMGSGFVPWNYFNYNYFTGF